MSPKKIILAVSFLAVFSFLFNFNALSVKAMTVAKIQAMISQLQAQITQLQQQLAATQVTGTSWCHNFNINLKIGISGLDVEALQAALEKEGLYEKGTNSADFDEEIASAVVGFQEKYAGEILTPFKLKHGTGFVGTGTRAKLNKLYGCNVITTSTPTTSVPVTTSATTTTSVSTTTSASAATPTPAATPISSITPTQTPASSITVSSPSGGGSTVASTTATTSSPDLSEFKVVELVENNLPNSITFWTTAYCPGDGTAFDYTIPTGYQKEFCISGPNGSHGGCSSCAMREIKLIKVNPSITVISPNAGEQWMIGETHDIKWNATEVNNVMIDLVSGSNSWHLAYYLPASQATFSWNLGSTTAGSSYKIHIWDSTNAAIEDYSDSYFGIVASTSAACADSDGGQNYYTKGTATGYYPPEDKSNATKTDYCRSIYVDGSDPSWVQEFFCFASYITQASFHCPYGCSDGACLATSTSASSTSYNINNVENQLANISAMASQLVERVREFLGK